MLIIGIINHTLVWRCSNTSILCILPCRLKFSMLSPSSLGINEVESDSVTVAVRQLALHVTQSATTTEDVKSFRLDAWLVDATTQEQIPDARWKVCFYGAMIVTGCQREVAFLCEMKGNVSAM